MTRLPFKLRFILSLWLVSVSRSCGVIPHGEWVQKGCSYCRCGYGTLHCFPHVFHRDCGKLRPYTAQGTRYRA